MTRRKSVQELVVKPLRRFSLRNSKSQQQESLAENNTADMSPKEPACVAEQHDIVSWLPREIALQIFCMLPFNDLVTVQCTCRLWRHIAQDPFIWRTRYQQLYNRYPDLYSHKQLNSDSDDNDNNDIPWQSKYCQARTLVNWRTGNVQRSRLICDQKGNRIISVKLLHHWLVSLYEDNTVRLFQYSTENGFQQRSMWDFGSEIVECVDILPELNIVAVAMRGSKCMFYDVNESEPIQVLKGGSHPWFVPDSVAISQDYFVISGRKPSAVFVWNWRKGVRLANRAVDNQPHSVYLSGDNVIYISVDGFAQTFNIVDGYRSSAVFQMVPCNMPCIGYDGSLSVVMAPFGARRIHHFQWQSVQQEEQQQEMQQKRPETRQRRLSSTISSSVNSLLGRNNHDGGSSSHHSGGGIKPNRLRKYSSYNDYGYACQARTAQYIKHIGNNTRKDVRLPDFSRRQQIVRSIRTSPLGQTTSQVVGLAIYNERVAIVNRWGDIALFALNGTTGAHVSERGQRPWMDETTPLNFRSEDDLSDGYDFIRSRLAMGSMGIIYGGRGGALWWIDFGCKCT